MKEVLQQFKQNYLIKYWNPVAAVIAAGLISAYYFGVTGTYWAVTGEFTRWGGHALQALGVDVSDWSYYKIIGMQGTIFTRIDGVMILGMFAGCISAALWANNVKWRNQPHKRRIVQALIGGALAGFGARLAMGCNLASLFTGIPQFSVHAWFFTIATAIGTYAGVKVTLLPMFRWRSASATICAFLSFSAHSSRLMFCCCRPRLPTRPARRIGNCCCAPVRWKTNATSLHRHKADCMKAAAAHSATV